MCLRSSHLSILRLGSFEAGALQCRPSLAVPGTRALVALGLLWLPPLSACNPAALMPSLRVQGQLRFSGQALTEHYSARLSAVLVFGRQVVVNALPAQTTWTVVDEETLTSLCDENPLCVQEAQMRGNIVVSSVP